MPKKKKKETDQPTRFLYDGVMPKFWPPKPNSFWNTVLYPIQLYYAHYIWKVKNIDLSSVKETFSQFGPDDGILIAPNHSHEADAHVLLETSRLLRSQFYFMAAWQTFAKNNGIDGFALQRMGAFSVDREGTDRRSLRFAIDLLANGKKLVVFPEGEIHHLNDRLKPILDGVAFMALSAQKQITKEKRNGKIWLLPTCIKYSFSEDVTQQIEEGMKKLEQRLFWWKPKEGASLSDRMIDFGDALLTIKEKEKLGQSFDHLGDLSKRIDNFINALLIKHEETYFQKSSADKNTPLRVKALRRKCIDIWINEESSNEVKNAARHALDDIQLALQLFSYPGNYIKENPSIERMAETLEKYMEDVFAEHHPVGLRKAALTFAKPLDISDYLSKPDQYPNMVSTITDHLEESITQLL